MKNNTLPEYQEYPRSKSLVKKQNITFYAHWASIERTWGSCYILCITIEMKSSGDRSAHTHLRAGYRRAAVSVKSQQIEVCVCGGSRFTFLTVCL